VIEDPVYIYHSAVATFFAPSDISGMRGMRRERIHACPSWRGKEKRYDCAFVVEDEAESGMRGLAIVRVKLLFSFKYGGVLYPCALVEWFKKVGDSPDSETGMWSVEPDCDRRRRRVTSVLHLDTFFRGAHLIPVFYDCSLPHNFHFSHSLDAFSSYYVNKYIDHHANEIAF
jgi:hypothetical protein